MTFCSIKCDVICKKVAKHVGTRDTAAIRSHAQVYLVKLVRDKKSLPAKMLETGNGYTLSGQPLNKYSAVVLKIFKG